MPKTTAFPMGDYRGFLDSAANETKISIIYTVTQILLEILSNPIRKEKTNRGIKIEKKKL